MGGQEFEGKILTKSAEFYEVQIKKKNGKVKTIVLWTDRIFSVTQNEKETVLYQQDSTDESSYSETEMRQFIYGHQDANENYKTAVPILVSAGVSAAISFALASQGNGLFLTTPIFGTVSGTLSKANKPKPKNARNDEILASPAYVEGFRKGARSKKLLNSFLASLVGCAVGGTSGIIYLNNN